MLNGAVGLWSCPAAPAPACTSHRLNTTPVALLANTAMLDEPGVVAAADVNAKSSNVTAAVTWSA